MLLHTCQGKRRVLTEGTSSQRYWRREYLFLGQYQPFADVNCSHNHYLRVTVDPKQCQWIWVKLWVKWSIWNHKLIIKIRRKCAAGSERNLIFNWHFTKLHFFHENSCNSNRVKWFRKKNCVLVSLCNYS